MSATLPLLARTVQRTWAGRDALDPAELHRRLDLIGAGARELGGRPAVMRVLSLATNKGPGRPADPELRQHLLEAWAPYLRWGTPE